MRRLFWLVMGVTIGALLVRKLTKTAQKFTPSGLGETLSGAAADTAAAVRDFIEDVRVSTAERAKELRESAGIDATGTSPYDENPDREAGRRPAG